MVPNTVFKHRKSICKNLVVLCHTFPPPWSPKVTLQYIFPFKKMVRVDWGVDKSQISVKLLSSISYWTLVFLLNWTISSIVYSSEKSVKLTPQSITRWVLQILQIEIVYFAFVLIFLFFFVSFIYGFLSQGFIEPNRTLVTD